MNINHQTAYFNNPPVAQTNFTKHLGMYLDEHLNSNQDIREKIAKVNKGIGIIRRLNNILSRPSLITIYKSFVRHHLDYCDIIYDQLNNETLVSYDWCPYETQHWTEMG